MKRGLFDQKFFNYWFWMKCESFHKRKSTHSLLKKLSPNPILASLKGKIQGLREYPMHSMANPFDLMSQMNNSAIPRYILIQITSASTRVVTPETLREPILTCGWGGRVPGEAGTPIQFGVLRIFKYFTKIWTDMLEKTGFLDWYGKKSFRKPLHHIPWDTEFLKNVDEIKHLFIFVTRKHENESQLLLLVLFIPEALLFWTSGVAALSCARSSISFYRSNLFSQESINIALCCQGLKSTSRLKIPSILSSVLLGSLCLLSYDCFLYISCGRWRRCRYAEFLWVRQMSTQSKTP